MVRTRMHAIVVAAVLSLAMGVAISGAASDDVNKNPGKPAATAAKPSTSPQAPAQGIRVFIDPVTGKIREADPGEIQQLTPAAPAATSFRAAPLSLPLRGPGNATGMKLDDSQMVYSVATKNADGSISFECVTGAANADKELSRKPNERSQPDVK